MSGKNDATCWYRRHETVLDAMWWGVVSILNISVDRAVDRAVGWAVGSAVARVVGRVVDNRVTDALDAEVGNAKT